MIRFIIGVALVFGGFELGARLQVWDPAVVYVKCDQPKSCVYEGRVSRQLVGDMTVIDQANGRQVLIPSERVQTMSWNADAAQMGRPVLAMLLGWVLAGVVFFQRPLG